MEAGPLTEESPGPAADSGSGSALLDFGVADLDLAQEKVLALGASVLDDGSGGQSRRIYADPAGHPFCLARH